MHRMHAVLVYLFALPCLALPFFAYLLVFFFLVMHFFHLLLCSHYPLVWLFRSGSFPVPFGRTSTGLTTEKTTKRTPPGTTRANATTTTLMTVLTTTMGMVTRSTTSTFTARHARPRWTNHVTKAVRWTNHITEAFRPPATAKDHNSSNSTSLVLMTRSLRTTRAEVMREEGVGRGKTIGGEGKQIRR